MTVKELIEFLQTCPEDAPIHVLHGNDEDGQWWDRPYEVVLTTGYDRELDNDVPVVQIE